MQCIVCGVETKLLKSFDRVTAAFCAEHYTKENESKQERKVVLVEI